MTCVTVLANYEKTTEYTKTTKEKPMKMKKEHVKKEHMKKKSMHTQKKYSDKGPKGTKKTKAVYEEEEQY